MTPQIDILCDKQWDVWQGDCLDLLKRLPDGCVDCCVTSPPYYGLRDYGHDGQIGLEPTPREYVAKMVAVFSECRRILKDDGVCWLNLGDSYCNSNGFARARDGWQRGGRNNAPANDRNLEKLHQEGFKTKDLLGVPWRVAFALQEDGWYLRDAVVWHKPNPMPESVRDRCTKAYEMVFMLTKSEIYYFDAEAIAETATHAEKQISLGAKSFSRGQALGAGIEPTGNSKKDSYTVPSTRNRRNVWTISTQPCKEAHFAVMPSALAEPCILAGCPPGGIVLDPFGGSGTVGAVALKHGRRTLLCELNEQYISEILRPRLECAAAQPRLEFDEPQECKAKPEQFRLEHL